MVDASALVEKLNVLRHQVIVEIDIDYKMLDEAVVLAEQAKTELSNQEKRIAELEAEKESLMVQLGHRASA